MAYRKVRVGGAFVTKPEYVRIAGAWVIKPRFVRVAGVWVPLDGGGASTSHRIVSGGAVSPADATAVYELNADGKIYQSVNTLPKTFVENWLQSGVNSDYQLLATVTSGTLSTGLTGSWVSCASGGGWSIQRTNNAEGVSSATFTLQIRRVSDLVVIDTSTITLNAEVTV